jgi:6-phosphogluconolactonase
MRPEIVVGTLEQLAAAFAVRLEHRAAASIAARGRFSIALTGGSSAADFCPLLAGCRIDWTRTDFFWGDERAVAITDPESNFALADRLWLRPAAVPRANIHRLRADLPDLEQAAAAAERDLVRILGEPPRLDLVWLGVGGDGHVASLFPGHSLLGEGRRLVVPIFDSPKPPARRLTLTLAAIAAARFVVVTAMGGAKAAVLAAALGDASSQLPLALVLKVAEDACLLLDEPAARDLPADVANRTPSR